MYLCIQKSTEKNIMVSLLWNYAMLNVIFDILFDHSPRPSIVWGLSVSTGAMLDPTDTKDFCTYKDKDKIYQETLELAAQQSKSFHQVIVERKNFVWKIIKTKLILFKKYSSYFHILQQLAREGDAATISTLLEKLTQGNHKDFKIQRRINALDDNKTSPLHYAAR